MVRRPPRSTRTDTLFPYTTLFRSIIQCSCRGSVDLVEEIACENAGGNALVAERVAPMDARVDDSKSLLRYGIGDVWIGRSINPDVPACCRQIPGPRLIAVLARDRDCAVIARKRDIVARSEEHTSEIPFQMRSLSADSCL